MVRGAAGSATGNKWHSLRLAMFAVGAAKIMQPPAELGFQASKGAQEDDNKW